jgi:hypothetical protein
MTAIARDGRDSPFGDWVRRNPQLDSRTESVCVTNADWTFMKYRDDLCDRGLKLILDLEEKTHDARPDQCQQELLFFRHQLALTNGVKWLWSSFIKANVAVIYFGHFVLRMEGECPDDGKAMWWGTFDTRGNLSWRRITRAELTAILAFSVDPSGEPIEETLVERIGS